MGLFGWSMPPGCSGTPFDEAGAEELKVAGLPDRVLAFWVDGETIVIQRFLPEGEVETLLRFDHLGDDDLSEAQNSADAADMTAQKWQEYLATPATMVELGTRLLRRIKVQVQLNDHGEAYLLAAKALGCEELVQRFERINRQHLSLGHLPPRLNEARRTAYEALLVQARKKLSAGDYQRLYGVL